MNSLTSSEMLDMHLAYGAANVNARQAARLYQERLPNSYIPDYRMSSNLHQRLRDNERFEINQEILVVRGVKDVEEAVLDHFHLNPRSSTREAAAALGLLNYWGVRGVLNGNHYHPYYFQRIQALNQEDYDCRVQFAELVVH